MGMNLSRLDDGELFECSNEMWGIAAGSGTGKSTVCRELA